MPTTQAGMPASLHSPTALVYLRPRMRLWYPEIMQGIGNNPTVKVLEHHLPWCLCAEDAARYLGWPTYCLTLLVRAGHIKPLGKPAQNSRKWYSTVDLARLGQDPAWLDKAIRILEARTKQANRKSHHTRMDRQGPKPDMS